MQVVENTTLVNQTRSWILLGLCFLFTSTSLHAQRYVEISADIELISWPGDDPNGASRAKPRIISLLCITGTNEWRVEGNFMTRAEEKWMFDGTNVFDSIRATQPSPPDTKDKFAERLGLEVVAF